MESVMAKEERKEIVKNDAREKLMKFESIISQVPGAVFGDSDKMPLRHSFSEGIYVREIFIPKGYVLTGKIHKHSHPNFLMRGEVMVFTEGGGTQNLKAPLSMISEPGTKRAVMALEDTVWITVHATNETDLEKIEDYVIAKSFEEYDKFALENRNCLILALKAKNLNHEMLHEIKSNGALLPFKESLAKLKENKISLDGLFAEKTKENEWHVQTTGGIPLEEVDPKDEDLVGSWVAVGATTATAAGSYFGSKSGSKGSSASQVPLETAEQRAARMALMQFANTGKFGDFTAGGDAGVKSGDWNMTGIEREGQTELQKLLASGIPDQFKMGNEALASILNPNADHVTAMFDPFKQQVERQVRDSNTALKRNAGFAGNLYSTNTIRSLGDIEARGNETLTAQLAALTNSALDRRLQAVPIAYAGGTAQEDITQGRIAAANQFGGLERALKNAGIEQGNAETLRRRNESLMPLDALKTVAGTPANFGVPSVETARQNPMLDLLTAVISAGGQYLGNRQTPKKNTVSYANNVG
jgi:hypothetical protein